MTEPAAKKKRPATCPGSGRRTRKTGSSAFPEVRCPCCEYEAAPVEKYGEVLIRAHRPKGEWHYPEPERSFDPERDRLWEVTQERDHYRDALWSILHTMTSDPQAIRDFARGALTSSPALRGGDSVADKFEPQDLEPVDVARRHA